MSKLLIVESPRKCGKIQEYLGAGWKVLATMGHIRALKEELAAIGFDAAAESPPWNPIFENLSSKQTTISALRRAAAAAREVYLGTDDDREGEAIAWHTANVLGLDPRTALRVVFREVTKNAITAAIATPTHIDLHRYEAQQARSMLDLLIGFTLSPCLWKAVGYAKGLSAGRCQSPALRLVFERDEEIERHASVTSWKLQASSAIPRPLVWSAKPMTEAEASAFLTALVSQAPQTITVIDRIERISTHQPAEPFITSTLQQAGSSRLSMNPKATMQAAQRLYEAGHITYMRTDSAVLSHEAQEAAEALVTERWGAEFLSGRASTAVVAPKKAKAKTKTKAKATEEAIDTAQNAHEAIRPTHMEVEELTDLTAGEQKLYRLIWQRTIQSVMADEQRDVVKLVGMAITTQMETSWDKTRFAGFRVLEAERKPEEETTDCEQYEVLKGVVKGTALPWTVFTANEVRSPPPRRYTEADLIHELEKRNIGRPATFAPLVETVKDRGYVEVVTSKTVAVELRGMELKAGAKSVKPTKRTEKTGGEKGKLHTTALGRTVITWLLSQFEDIIDYDVTAHMEASLDRIANGEIPWNSVLQETWTKYADRYRTIMASASTVPSANCKEFGDGYKLVVSKKGPLFVHEVEGEKTRFASVPESLSVQTATLEDALSAFASPPAQMGDALGTLEGDTVIRKTGKFGPYVEWKGFKQSCKEDDTLESLTDRLLAKIAPDAVDHLVGPFKIKRGVKGNLFMFKLGGPGKPVFVDIPEDTDWARLTPEGADKLYKSQLGGKGKVKGKGGTK